jgi:hypothetical protein
MNINAARRREFPTMKETDLATKFRTTFARYNPQVITNNSQGGWPDRMLQAARSVVVFVELKVVTPNLDGTFFLGLRQDQAVWLTKWQSGGGKCFLFAGILDSRNNIYCYGVLTMSQHQQWLKAPKLKYTKEAFTRTFYQDKDITYWFENYLHTE